MKPVTTFVCLFMAASSAAMADDYSAEVLADGLDYPWDIVTLGETILLTEKAGFLVSVRDGVVERTALATSSPVLNRGGGGLLGFALAPDFSESGQASAYYSYESEGRAMNRVVAVGRVDGGWRETDGRGRDQACVRLTWRRDLPACRRSMSSCCR